MQALLEAIRPYYDPETQTLTPINVRMSAAAVNTAWPLRVPPSEEMTVATDFGRVHIIVDPNLRGDAFIIES